MTNNTLASVKSKGQTGQSGFTLIELILAMAVFAFLLILLSVGVLQVMRMYQADIASRRTQDAARLVIDRISDIIHESSIIDSADITTICLNGNTGALWFNAHSLYKVNQPSDCPGIDIDDPKVAIIDGSNNTGVNIQVREFAAEVIKAESGSNQLVNTSVKVSFTLTTGAEDLFDGPVCKPAGGSQFCSATTFTNIISLRGAP